MERLSEQTASLLSQVEQVLDRLRPMLQMDDGDVELLGIEEGIVTLRLTGACGGCPMSSMTLTVGIERALKERIPEVLHVVAV